MSVLSPVVQTWDGENRRIYLKQGITEFYPIEDIYHEYRYARRTNEELRKYEPLLRAEGNVPKGAGAFTPRYVVLLQGTKIVPYDEPSQLNQLGDMITDNPDLDPSLYDINNLTTAKPIFIKPSEAETIQLNNESIVFSSFQGAVWYHKDSPYGDKGTATRPNGNTERPVNNMALAVQIANERGFYEIHLRSDAVIGAGVDIRNKTIVGINEMQTTLHIEEEAETLNCEIKNCSITGYLDGNTTFCDCRIGTLHYINGIVKNSTLLCEAIIYLDGNESAKFINCQSGTESDSIYPTINLGGSGQPLAIRNYNGGIKITNKNGPEKVSIDMNSGVVLIDPSVISGIIEIRGDCRVINNATGETIVNMDSITIPEVSYNGTVFIDTLHGIDGSLYPFGTESKPVKTLGNAVTIAEHYNFSTYNILGTIISDKDFDFAKIKGRGGTISTFFDFNNRNYVSVLFETITVSGILNSGESLQFKDCYIKNVSNFSGYIINSSIEGSIFVKPNGYFSGIGLILEGDDVVIDLQNSSAIVSLDIESGLVTFKNAGEGSLIELNVKGGEIALHESCIAGEFYAEGIGELYNNSSMIIKGNHLISLNSIPDTIWNENVSPFTTPNTFGHFIKNKLLTTAKFIGLK